MIQCSHLSTNKDIALSRLSGDLSDLCLLNQKLYLQILNSVAIIHCNQCNLVDKPLLQRLCEKEKTWKTDKLIVRDNYSFQNPINNFL
jgi:hypothetical protein